MSDIQQRASRYYPPPEEQRKPIRLNTGDMRILKLFESGRFKYLTAEIIACITARPINRVQHRLRDLWEHGYVRRYYPPYEAIGGSPKAVYLLDDAGAGMLSEALGRKVKVSDFDSEKYHQNLEHTLAVNWFRGLTIAACAAKDGIALKYEYLDREFVYEFAVKLEQREIEAMVVPDWVFGIGSEGQPTKNFFLEMQRPSRKTKEPTKDSKEIRSLKDKFRDYYYFYKKREAFEAAARKDYPEIENLGRMLVLVVTDTSEKEHENLIELARSVDETKHGLRIFWFARRQDFYIRKMIGNKEIEVLEPMRLFEPIWRTPVEGDELKSILENR